MMKKNLICLKYKTSTIKNNNHDIFHNNNDDTKISKSNNQ